MKILRSAPDGSNNIVTSVYQHNSDEAVMQNILCAGNSAAGAPSITDVSYLTIAVCKWVDASNFCVKLPAGGLGVQFGDIIEVIPQGGIITIFPTSGSFFDGTTSFSTSVGARFRYVLSVDGSTAAWARID